VPPERLTVELVEVLARRIKFTTTSAKHVASTFGMTATRDVFDVTNKEALVAVLRAMADCKDNELFGPNLKRLQAKGVLAGKFPTSCVCADERNNVATLQWLIAFYVELPGNSGFRGFKRKTKKDESPWPQGPQEFALAPVVAASPVTMFGKTAALASGAASQFGAFGTKELPRFNQTAERAAVEASQQAPMFGAVGITEPPRFNQIAKRAAVEASPDIRIPCQMQRRCICVLASIHARDFS
jgi:hypothetical protein